MSGFFGGGGGSATTDAGDLTSGVLAHERGGLEADVSAYSGLIKIASGSTSQATAGTDYQAVLTGLADVPGSDKLAESRGGLGSITGLIKAASGTASAAVAGTDYYAPGGTDVALADGGTGASTAAGARTNLGAQPFRILEPDNSTWTALVYLDSLGLSEGERVIVKGDASSYIIQVFPVGEFLDATGGSVAQVVLQEAVSFCVLDIVSGKTIVSAYKGVDLIGS